MTIKRTNLALVETLTLCEYVKAHYVALGLTDAAFADKCTVDLGPAKQGKYTFSHIATVWNALGIPATKIVVQATKKAAKQETIKGRLETLEKKHADLNARFEKLLAALS